ncbi:MAG: hypothetical protein LBJ67_05700 [Planctomycetaceae bacterium]|nr:hypothetical protein [Planctomycetaceae bacterium]
MSFIDDIASQSFKALVSKGVYALLFPIKITSGTPSVVTDSNLLNGYPVGTFNGSGDTADSEEFQDQLRGGLFKMFAGGAIDPGDVTLNTYFAPELGRPKLPTIVNSEVISPQFLLILAVGSTTSGKLKGFFAAGVNYSGGNDIKGDYGKIIGSSLKFKISGLVKAGYDEIGEINKSLYGTIPGEEE